MAQNAAPGQSVTVRVTETGERIPISMTDFSRADGTITIVVQKVGRTSALVRQMRAGDVSLTPPAPRPGGAHSPRRATRC